MDDTNNILAYFHVPFWLIALLAAYYAYTRQLDIKYSSRFATHGGSEGNRFMRDEYGFFTAKRNIIASVAVGVAILVLCATVSTQMSFLFIALGVFGHIVAIFKNKKATRYDRDQAKQFLRGLAAIVADGADPNRTGDYLAGTYQIANGRTWRVNIPTVYSTKTGTYPVPGVLWDGQQAYGSYAIDEVDAKLIELVKKPETEWFPN